MDFAEERERLVYRARVAAQAGLYNEMVDEMKKLAKLDVELIIENKNLLSIVETNIINPRRNSWWTLSWIEQKEELEGNEVKVKGIKGYREKVESELETICSDIIALIDQQLIPSSTTDHSAMLFYITKGNLYRYLAEFKSGIERKEFVDQSLEAYQTATTTGEFYFFPAEPIWLLLALNFSIFYYETMNSPERAIQLAKQAYDEAIEDLDSLSKESPSYRESTLNMQLLRHHLTIYASGAMGKRISVETLASALESFTPEEQRMVLGNNLYPLVEQLEGHEAACKVTGMLQELDQNKVLHLLESPEALKAEVAEVMEFLRNASNSPSAAADQLDALSLSDDGGLVS